MEISWPQSYLKRKSRLLFWAFATIRMVYILSEILYLVTGNNDAYNLSFSSQGLAGWVNFVLVIIDSSLLFMFAYQCHRKRHQYFLSMLSVLNFLPAALFMVHIIFSISNASGSILSNIVSVTSFLAFITWFVLMVASLASKWSDTLLDSSAIVSIVFAATIIPLIIISALIASAIHLDMNQALNVGYILYVFFELSYLSYFAVLAFSKPVQPNAQEQVKALQEVPAASIQVDKQQPVQWTPCPPLEVYPPFQRGNADRYDR